MPEEVKTSLSGWGTTASILACSNVTDDTININNIEKSRIFDFLIAVPRNRILVRINPEAPNTFQIAYVKPVILCS